MVKPCYRHVLGFRKTLSHNGHYFQLSHNAFDLKVFHDPYLYFIMHSLEILFKNIPILRLEVYDHNG